MAQMFYYRIAMTPTLYGSRCDCPHASKAAKQVDAARVRMADGRGNTKCYFRTDPHNPLDSIIATEDSGITKCHEDVATVITRADATTLTKGWGQKAPDGSDVGLKVYKAARHKEIELDKLMVVT